MIRAELIHNPYLLETDVLFNECEPKINSPVERYRPKRLQDWINKLPDIFYSEMNGWDFALDFSGTTLDFACLQKAFDRAGVSRESVCLFYKNELENVAKKESEISKLISWFEEIPNRKFDFRLFKENNSQLLDDTCTYILIQGGIPAFTLAGVNIESVSGINELEKYVLENTPLLLCVNEDNYNMLRYNLSELKKREGEDIFPAQIFFYLDPVLNRPQIERMIKDLGIDQPQIVETPTDNIVKEYLDLYPKTAYVQRMITALRTIKSEIDAVLQTENERSIDINSGIRQRIDELDETIQYLKNANEQLTQRDNFVAPADLQSAKNGFMRKIADWRKKKIKITSDSEAGSAAVDFEKDIKIYFNGFIGEAEKVFESSVNEIYSYFASVYSTARFEDGYSADQSAGIDLNLYELPKFLQGLLDFKTERMVEQGENIIWGLFKKASDNKEPVREVTYQYSDWRNYAADQTEPVINDIIQAVNEVLEDLYERVAEDYLKHLEILIEQQSKTKSEVIESLSDDEQKLQEDNDWFALFQEKLLEIERR